MTTAPQPEGPSVTIPLRELQNLITLEGFGCACEPTGPCRTCRAREVLRRTLAPLVEKYAALAAPEVSAPVAASSRERAKNDLRRM